MAGETGDPSSQSFPRTAALRIQNMEESGTSAWVEVETIRTIIEAYGKGEITLPKVPEKTPQNQVRYVRENSRAHPYTKATIAQFVGWTSKTHEAGLRPNHACETAFRALDMLAVGIAELAQCAVSS